MVRQKVDFSVLQRNMRGLVDWQNAAKVSACLKTADLDQQAKQGAAGNDAHDALLVAE